MGIAAGSLLALIFRFASTFLWAAIGVLTARTLEVADRGLYASVVVATSATGSIISLGAATGFYVANRRRDPAEVASAALTIIGVVTVLALLAAAAAPAAFPGERGRILAIGALLVPPAVIRGSLGGVYLGQGRLVLYNVVSHLPVVAGFAILATVLVALGRRSAEAALLGWLVANYAALLPLVLDGRSWWARTLRVRPSRELVFGVLRFTSVTGLAGVVGMLNYRVDLLLVVALDSREGAGIYASSIAGAEALWLVSSAIAMASFARVGNEDRAGAARITAAGVRHTLLIVAAGAIILAAAAPWAVVFLFGPAYAEAALPLRVLCIGTLFYAPQALLNNYFANQLGRPVLPLAVGLLSLIVNIAVGVATIPTYGFVGAAWGTTISYVASGLAAAGLFLWLAPVRPGDLWRIRRGDLERYPALARELTGRVRRARG